VGGRYDIRRRADEGRKRHEQGSREHEQRNWRRRRRKYKIGWHRSEEDNWRRRHKAKRRVAEHKDRAIDVDDFGRRRRRDVIDDRGNGWRRLQGRRQRLEPPPRAGRMRAVRIAAEIGPVSLWRVDVASPPPNDRFPARSEQRPNALCQRVGWIGGKKFLISLPCVALDRRSIGILRSKIAHRPRSHRVGLAGPKR